jgi:membrane-bound inhibitor of C-type lysozyme
MNTKTYLGIILVIVVAIVIALSLERPNISQNKPINTVLYSCNAGKTITAVYYNGESKPAVSSGQPPIPGGRVELTLNDGSKMTLSQTISADGIRYANTDESFVFWSKGNGALVLENNVEKTYIGCIAVAPESQDENLPAIYSNSAEGFSLRLPSLATSTVSGGQNDYLADESYKYQELGPGKDIGGVKFTIPALLSAGTNLSSDSYISVEKIPQTQNCSANLFLDQGASAVTVTDNGKIYSVASSTGAAAGNRYEETIYAIPGTNPCVAVRYFIHYGVFENYPAGAVKEFDKETLLNQFNAIRRTLVI